MTEEQQRAPEGFEGSTQLPADEEERARWQAENRAWWENHPMRYDWKQSVPHAEFSAEFYQEIDRRFFSSAREFMPWKQTPFDPLIDFVKGCGFDAGDPVSDFPRDCVRRQSFSQNLFSVQVDDQVRSTQHPVHL